MFPIDIDFNVKIKDYHNTYYYRFGNGVGTVNIISGTSHKYGLTDKAINFRAYCYDIYEASVKISDKSI